MYYNNQVYQNEYRIKSVPFIPDNKLESGPYIENNLLLNINKKADFHMSFPDSQNERDKIFHGEIIEAARDHIMLKSLDKQSWVILPLTYLNYVEFLEEPIIYTISP